MIDPLKRHEVQVLLRAGFSVRQVAVRAGVPRQTVQRIGSEAPVVAIDDPHLRALKPVGRPSTVAAYRADVEGLLDANHDVATHEVLRLLRLKGYAHGKSAVYDLVRELRPPSIRPVVRFEGVPGEFSQHDFGEVEVTYRRRRTERLHFFASRLKYSRYSHVELVLNQRVEALVRALLAGLEAFGGVPLFGVFDNPKTIVLHRQGDWIEWNPVFGQAVLDLRLGVELCWPHRPREKGAVERLVGWVKSSFFKVRHFADREDVKEQLTEWLRETNEKRPSRATGVVPAERLAVERPRLRPLPIASSDFALRVPVVVGPTGFVEYRGVRYAMPPKAIGLPGTLHLYPDRVWIVAGAHEARLPRVPEDGTTSWGADGRAALLAAVSGERARLYAMRQQLLEVGGVAEAYLTEIVHRRPFAWKVDVIALHQMLQLHGVPALREAMGVALGRQLYGASYVKAALEDRVA